ncbi:MAG: ATP-binding protein, partial [Gemmatimonadales bacterium]
QLPRIFEPRFSTTSSGAGLGLAIAKRLVEGWGGEITAESEAGKGTTVTLSVSPL